MLFLMNSFWEVAVDLVDRADATGLSECQKREAVRTSLDWLHQATRAHRSSPRNFGEMDRLVDAAMKISRQFQMIGTDPVDDTTFESIIGHLK